MHRPMKPHATGLCRSVRGDAGKMAACAVSDLVTRWTLPFEGVVPGTHVVQVSRAWIAARRRTGWSIATIRPATPAAPSRALRSDRGGSLVVADFHAVLPEGAVHAEAGPRRRNGLTSPRANWY